jgi:hypothetical protein
MVWSWAPKRNQGRRDRQWRTKRTHALDDFGFGSTPWENAQEPRMRRMVFQLPSQRSGLNMKKRSGKSGDIPMLFILWLITFTMLFASMSRASGAPLFEVEAICRTAIASIMGRDPKMMQVTLTTGDVLFLTYVRPIDNFVWNYRCRIEGNRVLWASESGRWRDDPKDEKVFFEVIDGGKQLRIIEDHGDGSSTNQLFDRDTFL